VPYSFTHDYPPADWTADELEGTLREEPQTLPVIPYSDRAAWSELADDAVTGPAVDRALEEAADERETPPTSFSASAYLQWMDGGEGAREWHSALNDRLRRLWLFVMAECVERDGQYLDAILDDAWELCHLPTWSYPHELEGRGDRQLRDGLPVDVPLDHRYVGLASASVARRLAEVCYTMGTELHPTLRERVRDETERRVLAPFEERDDLWWTSEPGHNITAVCSCRTALAALYLDLDEGRLAELLLETAGHLENYLSGFDADGCWPEGVGYWSFGFIPYVSLAHHLETRTGGQFSLLSPPVVEEIARFPLRVELSPDRFVPFADSGEEHTLSPYLLCWLGRRLGLRGLAARGREEFLDRHPHEARTGTKGLLAARQVPAGWQAPERALREFFSGCKWWIARASPDDPDAVSVAAKAGRNDQSHNHNDGGSFVVHVGRESLLTDLGSGAYDGDYFGDERYEYVAARSLGHSVPHVNGYEQRAGEDYAAAVTDRAASADRDSIAMELAGCYPDAAGLESLRRDVELDRTTDPARVTVSDAAEFRPDAPGTRFESVLVSRRPFEETDDGLVVEGDAARLTVRLPDDATVTAVEHIEYRRETDESYDRRDEKPIDAWRARVGAPDPSGEPIRLSLSVVPEHLDA